MTRIERSAANRLRTVRWIESALRLAQCSPADFSRRFLSPSVQHSRLIYKWLDGRSTVRAATVALIARRLAGSESAYESALFTLLQPRRLSRAAVLKMMNCYELDPDTTPTEPRWQLPPTALAGDPESLFTMETDIGAEHRQRNDIHGFVATLALARYAEARAQVLENMIYCAGLYRCLAALERSDAFRGHIELLRDAIEEVTPREWWPWPGFEVDWDIMDLRAVGKSDTDPVVFWNVKLPRAVAPRQRSISNDSL